MISLSSPCLTLVTNHFFHRWDWGLASTWAWTMQRYWPMQLLDRRIWWFFIGFHGGSPKWLGYDGQSENNMKKGRNPLEPTSMMGFLKWAYPKNEWFMRENPIKYGWLRGTPILGNLMKYMWEEGQPISHSYIWDHSPFSFFPLTPPRWNLSQSGCVFFPF